MGFRQLLIVRRIALGLCKRIQQHIIGSRMFLPCCGNVTIVPPLYDHVSACSEFRLELLIRAMCEGCHICSSFPYSSFAFSFGFPGRIDGCCSAVVPSDLQVLLVSCACATL